VEGPILFIKYTFLRKTTSFFPKNVNKNLTDIHFLSSIISFVVITYKMYRDLKAKLISKAKYDIIINILKLSFKTIITEKYEYYPETVI